MPLVVRRQHQLSAKLIRRLIHREPRRFGRNLKQYAARLAGALGDLLRVPPEPDTSHIRPTVSLERRLAVLRELLMRGGRFDFDDAFGEEDRLTQAVTLFALLEMHKRGEATWTQKKTFGEITIETTAADSSAPRPGSAGSDSPIEEAASG